MNQNIPNEAKQVSDVIIKQLYKGYKDIPHREATVKYRS